jgi:CheY-like chemotaxis protein
MSAPRPSILIVDDEPHMLRLVSFALRTVNATQLTATSGLDALQIIRTQTVHLGIFDIHMKDIDGLTAIRELRRDPAHRALPVILLTGAGETQVEEHGRTLGVQAFFRKPFSPAQLAARVRELLAAPPPPA